MTRNETKVVRVGNVLLGGGNPIRIQSMTNTKTADVKSTVDQILRLEDAGCEIIRCTVPDMESAAALAEIKKQIHIPLVADIHFDYRLAIAACENGADKIRINPGNIGSDERLKKVVDVCKERQIPIRVGVNAGSLDPEMEKLYGRSAEALSESAKRSVQIMEDAGFDNIVVAIKASNVRLCVESFRLFAKTCPYPLHVGLTEAGLTREGTIKSALAMGQLLSEGIGDTIRVSLTADPVEEVKAAKDILRFLDLRKFGPEIVSCPTCGRTNIDLIDLAGKAQKALEGFKTPMKVAVMGCVVNGPGEAKDADFGICGGKGMGLVIRKGEIVKKVPEEELLDALVEEARLYESTY
ncbi:MAG: flavodoxin-dependent (E)-4-hydroxy-3-methylbut-2-enyl-diphosphate synthase [Firmicutes bacterium]|nr:flavodoxin-dependent (E)-4-hydroxy-3-methylbut-2-enyl-diphosphate synthase [Bacillota bacterium]